MNVKNTLISTRMTPAAGGNSATLGTSKTLYTMMLAGMQASAVKPTPSKPAIRPSMMVSALNTRLISPFDAPIERRMPIYFLRSSTEMYVMTPIMMEDTMSEMATKAMSTVVIMSMMVVTDFMSVPTMSV